VVDASNEQAREQVQAVSSVLDEIGCLAKPTVLVLNKTDAVRDRSYLDVLRATYPDAVAVSARTKAGIDALETTVVETLGRAFVEAEVETAASNGKLLAYLEAHAIQHSRVYEDSRVVVQCRLPRTCVGDVLRLRGICRMNGQRADVTQST
jgi:GTP-binding protein HflX